MPDAPMPPQGAPDDGTAGENPADQLAAAGQALETVTSGITQDGQVPDAIKQLFQTALDSFKQGFQALTGGGDSSQPAPAQATPEQGASGAQPMSMQRPK